MVFAEVLRLVCDTAVLRGKAAVKHAAVQTLRDTAFGKAVQDESRGLRTPGQRASVWSASTSATQSRINSHGVFSSFESLSSKSRVSASNVF